MSRLALLALLVALIAVVSTGCATAPDSAEPGDDGLHSIVPDVVGMEESEAAQVLQDAGYQVGEIVLRPGEGADPGTVVEQDPIPSTSAPRDSAVDLVVAEP